MHVSKISIRRGQKRSANYQSAEYAVGIEVSLEEGDDIATSHEVALKYVERMEVTEMDLAVRRIP